MKYLFLIRERSLLWSTKQHNTQGFRIKAYVALVMRKHCSSILAVKTCMFLPAIKSVVKLGTNPMPLFKDTEGSPRLTTDSDQTFDWFCALARYTDTILSALEILTLPFVAISI